MSELPPVQNLFDSTVGEYIPLKNSLLTDSKYQQIVKFIVDDLKKIPNFHLKRQDEEFILRACRFIENLVKKKDKIDKLKLLTDVFVNIFNLNSDEQQILKATVQFLFDRKLIKKIAAFKIIKNYVVKFVSKQLFF